MTQYGLNPFRPRGDAYAGGCGRDSQLACTIRRPTRAPPCSKLSTSSSFFVVFSYSLSVRRQPVVISVGAVHGGRLLPPFTLPQLMASFGGGVRLPNKHWPRPVDLGVDGGTRAR